MVFLDPDTQCSDYGETDEPYPLSRLQDELRIYEPAPSYLPELKDLVSLDLFRDNEFDLGRIEPALYAQLKERDDIQEIPNREWISSYLDRYRQYAIFEYLIDVLKEHGYKDNSPVHHHVVDAIDECTHSYDIPEIEWDYVIEYGCRYDLGDDDFSFKNGRFINQDDFFDLLVFRIENDSTSAFKSNLAKSPHALENLTNALDFIKERSKGFHAPEKEVYTHDHAPLTRLQRDICYVADNRATIITRQPFDGELDGINRFRKDFSDTEFIPIYTWHDSYPSPHEHSYRTPVDFLVDTLGKELPSSWVKDALDHSSFISEQIAGRNFSPIEEAFEEKGLYIAPIEIREGWACPYHVGYTWANGFIADGFAITPKEMIGKSISYGREIWLEMLEQEISILNGYYCGDGFEAKVYDLQTKELIEKDHAVRYAECFKNIKIPTGATVLHSCPDLETTLELMKHSLRTHPQHQRSLLSLAQEARSASDALSKGAEKQVERTLESR